MDRLEGRRVKVKPGAEVEELYRDLELVVKSVIHYTGADGREYAKCLVSTGGHSRYFDLSDLEFLG